MNMPQRVWTNQQVSLGIDLVFGLAVLTEDGWRAVSDLDVQDVEMVELAIDNNASFPFKNELIEAKEIVRLRA